MTTSALNNLLCEIQKHDSIIIDLGHHASAFFQGASICVFDLLFEQFEVIFLIVDLISRCTVESNMNDQSLCILCIAHFDIDETAFLVNLDCIFDQIYRDLKKALFVTDELKWFLGRLGLVVLVDLTDTIGHVLKILW